MYLRIVVIHTVVINMPVATLETYCSNQSAFAITFASIEARIVAFVKFALESFGQGRYSFAAFTFASAFGTAFDLLRSFDRIDHQEFDPSCLGSIASDLLPSFHPLVHLPLAIVGDQTALQHYLESPPTIVPHFEPVVALPAIAVTNYSLHRPYFKF